ncbi:MAG: hypothetical protein ABI175_16030, partial [Polyangiales bacterium]
MNAGRSSLLLLLVATACQSPPGSSTTAATSASVSSTKSAVPSASTSASAAKGNDPLVDELCRALHATPEARRAACCNQTASLDLTDECTRGLQQSLALQAIALDAGEVHVCTADLAKAYATCDHIGPNHPAV